MRVFVPLCVGFCLFIHLFVFICWPISILSVCLCVCVFLGECLCKCNCLSLCRLCVVVYVCLLRLIACWQVIVCVCMWVRVYV